MVQKLQKQNFTKTTFLVWESLCISIQRHFIASEKAVTKDTQPVMKDKCSTRLKFHFIGKLTKKKFCPFTKNGARSIVCMSNPA